MRTETLCPGSCQDHIYIESTLKRIEKTFTFWPSFLNGWPRTNRYIFKGTAQLKMCCVIEAKDANFGVQ